MATLTAVVSTNANDGHEILTTWYIDGDTPPTMYSGRYGGDYLYLACRFQVPTITNTATINTATWRLYSAGDQTGTPILSIYADDVDNSAALGSGSGLPSNRTPTTATTSKSLTAGEWGTAGWRTVDVTAIIAEVVARAGWSAGNYITLVMRGTAAQAGGDYVGFEDYSGAGSNHSELVIDYTAAGTVTASPSNSVGGGATQTPTVTIPGVVSVSNSVGGGATTAPSASVPVTGATIYVNATADDGCNNGTGAGFSSTDTWMGSADYGTITAFWVFRNVAIPQGALLSSASLDYYVSSHFNRPDLRFYLVNADDVGTINGSNLLTQTLTTASTLQSYSARPSGASTVNAWASATTNIGAVNLLTAVQSVVNRPGWVSGNDIAVICQKDGGDGYSFVNTNDYSDGSSNAARFTFQLNTNPQISSVSTVRTGGSVTVSGYYLGSTSGVTLKHVASNTTVTQTLGTVGANSVTFTVVEGQLPPGQLELRLTGGSADATYTVTKLPQLSTSDWVEMVSPYTDTSSVGYGMSPALATGDRVEWKNAITNGGTITLTPTGVWGGGTIECRRWISSTGQWDAEGWITHTVSFVQGASVANSVSGGVTSSVSGTGTVVIADLAGAAVGSGTLAGQIPVTKKIRITGSNPVVNTMGAFVTNNYDKWFITQSNIDLSNYNGTAITVAGSGTNLQITSGLGEVSVSSGLQTGSAYKLVAFDDDLSHYFRFNGTIYEE